VCNDGQLEQSSVLELCKKVECEMRENGARLHEQIADSLERSQQVAVVASTASAAAAAAAVEAPTVRRTGDHAPAQQTGLDKSSAAANLPVAQPLAGPQ